MASIGNEKKKLPRWEKKCAARSPFSEDLSFHSLSLPSFPLFPLSAIFFERGGIRTRVSFRSSDQKSDPFDRARAPALRSAERREKREKGERERKEEVVEKKRRQFRRGKKRWAKRGKPLARSLARFLAARSKTTERVRKESKRQESKRKVVERRQRQRRVLGVKVFFYFRAASLRFRFVFASLALLFAPPLFPSHPARRRPVLSTDEGDRPASIRSKEKWPRGERAGSAKKEKRKRKRERKTSKRERGKK